MSRTKDLVNELLIEVFNNILSIEEKTLKAQGVELSMTEIHVLEAIRNTAPATMSNVAQTLRVTVGTLTTSISTLVKKEYVVRKKGISDKRVVFVDLTDLALEALKVHDKFHDEMIESVFDDLNIAEDEVLIKSLESVRDYFKKKY